MANTTFYLLDLGLFGEGGDSGAAAADAGQTSGVNAQDAAETKLTDGDGSTVTVSSKAEEFKKLVKGEYKAESDAYISDVVKGRLKSLNARLAAYEQKEKEMAPLLETLSKGYKVDLGGKDAISKISALVEDDSKFYESDAVKAGMDVAQYKEVEKLRRANERMSDELKNRQNDDMARQQYAAWMNEAEETAKLYPGFDLREELSNPDFRACLESGVGVTASYVASHYDTLMPQVLQMGAKQGRAMAAKDIAAKSARPSENGASSTAAAVTKYDPASMTREQRNKLAERAAKGERIVF